LPSAFATDASAVNKASFVYLSDIEPPVEQVLFKISLDFLNGKS
jgi:hypothetical protein